MCHNIALSFKKVRVVHVTVPILVPKYRLAFKKKKSSKTKLKFSRLQGQVGTLGHKLFFFHREITAPRTYLPILLKYKRKHTKVWIERERETYLI